MTSTYTALFPGDEIQMLIDTYLPNDEQYYPDDLVLESKPYPGQLTHRALSDISESSLSSLSSLSTSSIQSEDIPSDILDFISSAAPDNTDVFTDYTEACGQPQAPQLHYTSGNHRYGSPVMYNTHGNHGNQQQHPHSNHNHNHVFESVDTSYGSSTPLYHHHHHGNNNSNHRNHIDAAAVTGAAHRRAVYQQQGRSPTMSECSSSDTESSIDGSPLSEYIPLPVQSFKEGAPIDLESFADVEKVSEPTRGDTDEESIPCSPEPEQNTSRPRRKRPSRRRQKQLWEFILETLTNPTHNPECITWVDKDAGIFKFVKSQQVARLWGQRRQREMSYEYFSRAMRHYYSRNIMKRVPGKRLVYQFLSGAEGWRQYAMKSPQ